MQNRQREREPIIRVSDVRFGKPGTGPRQLYELDGVVHGGIMKRERLKENEPRLCRKPNRSAEQTGILLRSDAEGTTTKPWKWG